MKLKSKIGYKTHCIISKYITWYLLISNRKLASTNRYVWWLYSDELEKFMQICALGQLRFSCKESSHLYITQRCMFYFFGGYPQVTNIST